MRHETNSAVEDAKPLIIGVGRLCENGRVIEWRVDGLLVLVDELYSTLFTVSYVVKNAPAKVVMIGLGVFELRMRT